MLAALNLSRRRLVAVLALAPLVAVAVLAVLIVGRSHPAPSLASAPRHAGGVTPAAAPGREIPLPSWPKPRAGGTSGGGTTVLTSAQLKADPEAAQSFAQSRSQIHHAAAAAPSTSSVAPGAPSDAEVRAEVHQMNKILSGPPTASPGGSAGGGGSVGGDGTISVPPGIPQVVQRVIAGGNAIATFPYVYGGGHASFVDSAYDCSGSVSYALAAGGLLRAPETSGDLETWGKPGPGKWITVFANAGHVWMVVDGVRFDTSGRSGVYGSRWQHASRSTGGFVVRHWPGL